MIAVAEDKKQIARRIKQLELSVKKEFSQYAERERDFESKYEIGNLLGEGGFGTVYDGIRKKDSLQVAIKVLPKWNISNWERSEDFILPTEAAILQGLRHDNVVRLYDVYEFEKIYIYVMERPIKFLLLYDLLEEQEFLDENQARKFFRQVVNGCIYCKNMNVWHSDIKTENIVVDVDTGEIKIIDFGGATRTDKLNFSTKHEGTLEYCSPEQISNGHADPWEATVWSLGVLLYCMLYGELPFDSVGDIMDREPTFENKNISEDVKNILLGMLQKNTSSRLTLADVSEHAWLTGN